VEVQTDPRLRQTVTITAGETTQIALPGIGTVKSWTPQVSRSASTVSTLIPKAGSPDDFCERRLRRSPCGAYDVEVATHPRHARPSPLPQARRLQIIAGNGTVQLVDADGAPTDAYNFYVCPEGDDDYIAFTTSGSVQVAEGHMMWR
jgi:hypothetical protein